MSRVAVFASGAHDVARVAVAELLRAIPGVEWLVVRAQAASSPGRPAPVVVGEKPPPGDAYEWAAIAADPRVRLHDAAALSGDAVVRALRDFAPDLGLALATPPPDPSLTGVSRLGTIRLHLGLRPGFGDAAPPAFWELYAERSELGCTIRRVEPGGEAGPVLLQRRIPRRPFASLRGAALELERVGVEMTVEAVALLLGGNGSWTPQSADGAAIPAPTRAQEIELARSLRQPNPERAPRRWMKGVVFNGYTHLLRPIPRRLRGVRGMQRVVIFCYHRVNDDLRDSLTVGVEQFEDQMRFLAERYPLVSIEDVIAGTFRRDSARPVVAVTFDDGYLDNWEFAAPILARLRIPAGFFVTTGVVGNVRGFDHDRERLGHALPTMEWDQLRRLRELGFTIGSHTSTHVNFARADRETLRRDLAESRDALRERVGVEHPILAYPFGREGDMTPEGIALMRELGYAGGLSAYGGSNDGPIDPFDVRRQGVNYALSLGGFQAAVEGFLRPRLLQAAWTPPVTPAPVAPVGATVPARPPARTGRSAAPEKEPPLVAHVIHHLLMGGLENGLVNLVNAIPSSRYRHAIVCMAHYDDFRLRITRPDVEVIAMRVNERGLGAVTPELIRLFRRLRPAIVHSRNPSGLDGVLPAAVAGVPHRIHGEHGWETDDLYGRNRKNLWNRRLHAPLVHRYVALSKHQERYLVERVGIAAERVTQIYNGVDVDRFRPREPGGPPAPRKGAIGEPGVFVIGTVGRMQEVKDPLNLVDAFIELRRARPDLAPRLRLTMVGDGLLRPAVEARLRDAGAEASARLPGAREDVAEQLRSLDLFVLPSKAEGISNTILEAMATGLPVVATRVGGNPELVVEGETGLLVPSSDPAGLAAALARYAENAALAAAHGAAGRARAIARFSLDRMVARYTDLYDVGVRHPGVPGPVPAA